MTTATHKIPSGYKQTDIGVIPADWDVKTFKDICWVNQGLQIAIEKRLKNPTAKSKKYITIQYLNSGKETEYIDDYSPSVCCNNEDILMTRTGNTGIVISGVEGVFHNNFFKINFDKKQIEKDYLLYYLKDSKTKRIILEKAGTSTIPDLNHDDFYSIQIPIPSSKTERSAIATTLSDTDALIEKLEKLIEKKKNIKHGAMQELLTSKRRLPGFSAKWETKELGELLDYEQPTKYLVKSSDYSDDYSTPVLTAGKTFILGYTAEETSLFEKLPTIIFDDFTTAIKYVDFPFKAKSSAMKMLIPRSKDINLKFVFAKMQMIDFQLGDHKRYWISEYQNIEIATPKPDEQTAIATVLSDMDTEIEKLESQLTKYQNLKQGMMQVLLTGKIRLLSK